VSATLLVSEVYLSLQGESTWAGLRCAFVRLAGCHLRCVWCDSAFAFHGGERLTPGQVVERVEALDAPLVELTGGEPLLQPAVLPLMTQLADRGKTVLLETSGSLDISAVDPRVKRIVDLKPPGSGEAHANLWSNLDHLRPGDELKFVLASRADYEWARSVIAARRLAGRAELLMGMAHGAVSPAELAGWILADALPVRLQLQLHKILWDPEARGV
jgi:7-carboxy-7-deazaguanine synthase